MSYGQTAFACYLTADTSTHKWDFMGSFMHQHSGSKTSTPKTRWPSPVLHSHVASHQRLGAVAEPQPWQAWSVDTDKTPKRPNRPRTTGACNGASISICYSFYLSFAFIQGFPDWMKPSSARHIARLEAETGEDHQPLLPPCTLKHELLYIKAFSKKYTKIDPK